MEALILVAAGEEKVSSETAGGADRTHGNLGLTCIVTQGIFKTRKPTVLT